MQRTTKKYKHSHTAFVEALNKELAKLLLLKPMHAQELQDPERVWKIWVKSLNSIVCKMDNTKSPMSGMKPNQLNSILLSQINLKYNLRKKCYLKMV